MRTVHPAPSRAAPGLALALALALPAFAADPGAAPAPAPATGIDPAAIRSVHVLRADGTQTADDALARALACGDGQDCQHLLQRVASKPVVGVLFAPDAERGVRIAGVTPDGAAAGAGIRSGDRLLRIAGKAIPGATPQARVDEARRRLQTLDEATAVKLTYARDGREHTVSVTPKRDQRIMVITGDGEVMRPGGNVLVRRSGDRIDLTADSLGLERVDAPRAAGARIDGEPRVFTFTTAPDAPRTDRQTIRIRCKDGDGDCLKDAQLRLGTSLPALGGGEAIRGGMFRFDCKPGEACTSPQRLADAFRWNGLNLASVGPELGRYFGTTSGVLVISSGPALAQLQAGDVIRRVDGKAVDSPRAVMDALRDKPEDSTVAVDYLRDRAEARIDLKVPRTTALPLPPMPPTPPGQGAAPPRAGAATGTGAISRHRIVMVDRDGHLQTWQDDGDGLPPPMPPAPGAAPPPPPPAPPRP